MPNAIVVAKREELAAKQKALFDIYEQAGPELDLKKVTNLDGSTHDKATEIKRRNAELNALGEELELWAGKERVDDLGRKLTDPGAGPGIPMPDGEKSAAHLGYTRLGEAVVKHAEFESGFLKGQPIKLNLNVKNTFLTSAGFAPESLRTGRVEFFPTRPVSVIQHIPIVPTKMAAVKFMEETTFTNAAAETTEAIAYPEAVEVFTERSIIVNKVAVSLPVTDEQLEDVEGMEELLNNRLEFMIRQRLDSQLLVGTGIAPFMFGTENVAGIQTQALGADTTEAAVFKLMTSIRALGFAEPEVTFINPLKWQTVRLRTTADGIYIFGSPSDMAPDRLWGLPVVQTVAGTSTKAVCGAYGAFSEFRLKRDVEVQVGFVGTNFTDGKKTIRADMRGAMVHYRPKAFGVVTGL